MTSSRKKIYTKYGDEGETSLLYGGRVSKENLHTEAYGTTDEAASVMGLARAMSQDDRVKEILRTLQWDLFTVAAELATDPKRYDLFNQHFKPVTHEMVTKMEDLIDELESEIEMPNSFILPGASPTSAAIDMARSVVRRAERRVVSLKEQGGLTNPQILRYTNRLGDLLFVLARYQDRELPLDKFTGQGN